MSIGSCGGKINGESVEKSSVQIGALTTLGAIRRSLVKIVIVGAFGFPHGYAEVARVHAYASGLIANGVDVKVICLKALERCKGKAVNTEARGVYNGIPFEYACGTPIRANWATIM